jgi:hypothetical protein
MQPPTPQTLRTILAENYAKLGLTDTAAQKMLAGIGKPGKSNELPLEVLVKLLEAVSFYSEPNHPFKHFIYVKLIYLNST